MNEFESHIGLQLLCLIAIHRKLKDRELVDGFDY